VFELKKEILIVFLVLAIATLAFLPLCKAQFASVTVYGYTDKPYYKPGDTGTLKFWVYNRGTEDLILENITILYPWYNAVGLWGGNVTIVPSTSTVIKPGGNWSDTSSFTVPNDGRISSVSGSIRINVVTDKTTGSSSITINIQSAPFYFSLQNMDQLLTWQMILVVVILVCTLIIVAAMFLSVRRPLARPLSTESSSQQA
jgi:uncharacterized membrane protein